MRLKAYIYANAFYFLPRPSIFVAVSDVIISAFNISSSTKHVVHRKARFKRRKVVFQLYKKFLLFLKFKHIWLFDPQVRITVATTNLRKMTFTSSLCQRLLYGKGKWHKRKAVTFLVGHLCPRNLSLLMHKTS